MLPTDGVSRSVDARERDVTRSSIGTAEPQTEASWLVSDLAAKVACFAHSA